MFRVIREHVSTYEHEADHPLGKCAHMCNAYGPSGEEGHDSWTQGIGGRRQDFWGPFPTNFWSFFTFLLYN